MADSFRRIFEIFPFWVRLETGFDRHRGAETVSCADLDTDRGASVGDVSFQQAQNRSQLSGA